MARLAVLKELAVAIAYVAVGVVFLWPAVTPQTIFTQVQDVDSALISSVMGHTSMVLSGRLPSLWDFGIYYPIKDTLCLTEPMLFPAAVCMPLIHAMGSGPAHNAWIYFAWTATAIGGYAYLRSRDLDRLSSFLGGFCAAFSPDRLSHAVGHSHLFFQAGFPLVLLATDRMFRLREGSGLSSRGSGVFFGVIVMLQILSGFYIGVIFLLWCLFMVPATAWSSAGCNRRHVLLVLKRQAGPVVAVALLTTSIMLPVLRHYYEFGAGFPQNPLEKTVAYSATWKGYLLPPRDLQHCLTVPGFLTLDLLGKSGDLENTQYVGLSTLLLIVCGGVVVLRRRRVPALHCATAAYWLGLATVAAVAFVLSLGPFVDPDSESPIRLPFAYLYARLEWLRFMRAPARFAFVVQWAAAIAAAHGLALIRSQLKTGGRAFGAAVVAIGFTSAMAVEFLPLHTVARMNCRRDGLSSFLMAEKDRFPFVQVPAGYADYLTQLGWHFRPLVNGFSGYSPAYRPQELAFLDRMFPSDETLMLLRRWGVHRVFVAGNAPPGQIAAAAHDPRLRAIWSGVEGSLYEAVPPLPDFQDFLRRRRRDAAGAAAARTSVTLIARSMAADATWKQETSMSVVARAGDTALTEWISHSSRPAVTFTARADALNPAVCTRMRLRVRISNWYSLQERCAVYWTCAGVSRFKEERCVDFCVPADGQFHDVVLDLGELITWVADSDIRGLELVLGSRKGNRVAIESLCIEEGPIRWEMAGSVVPGGG